MFPQRHPLSSYAGRSAIERRGTVLPGQVCSRLTPALIEDGHEAGLGRMFRLQGRRAPTTSISGRQTALDSLRDSSRYPVRRCHLGMLQIAFPKDALPEDEETRVRAE